MAYNLHWIHITCAVKKRHRKIWKWCISKKIFRKIQDDLAFLGQFYFRYMTLKEKKMIHTEDDDLDSFRDCIILWLQSLYMPSLWWTEFKPKFTVHRFLLKYECLSLHGIAKLITIGMDFSLLPTTVGLRCKSFVAIEISSFNALI